MNITKELKQPRNIAVSSILGFLYAAGNYYWRYGFETTGLIRVILLIVRFLLAFAFVMFVAIPGTRYLQKKMFSSDIDESSFTVSDRKQLIRNCLIFAVCWLPFVIFKYPAAIQPDTWQGIWQFRHHEITGMQPVGYVVLTGLFMKIVNNNVGMFLFSLTGYLCYCYSFGYAMTYVDSLKIKKPVRLALFFLWISSPYTLGYIGVVVKDIHFLAGIMIVTITLMEISWHRKPVTVLQLAKLFGWSLVMYIFRPNGMLILLFIVFFYAIAAFRKKLPWKPILSFVLAIVCGFLITMALNFAYDVHKPKDSLKEALSIPFQQTARYARDHADDTTPEEIEAIDKVIPYSVLAERYDPRIADPVRWNYSGDFSAFVDYLGKAWLPQLMRHPDTYIASFVEQNYYMFSILASTKNISFFEGVTKYYELEYNFDCVGSWMYEDIFDEPSSLLWAREAVSMYCISVMNLPIPWITANVAICCYIVMFCWIMVFPTRKKRNDYSLIYYVPLIATLIMILAAPANQGLPRYLFPIVYLAPLIYIDHARRISSQPSPSGSAS